MVLTTVAELIATKRASAEAETDSVLLRYLGKTRTSILRTILNPENIIIIILMVRKDSISLTVFLVSINKSP